MAMADLGLQGRKTFKVFNQDFIVDERYVVTKELGQGAYGIVWYVWLCSTTKSTISSIISMLTDLTTSQRSDKYTDSRRRRNQESHQCL
jgi:hypothetical protein